MGIQRVKQKFPLQWILPGLAVVTFLLSWGPFFPPEVVEKSYSRRVYPLVSAIFATIADVVPFSWLDVCIPVLLLILIYSVARRRWRVLIAIISGLYLWFFWSWGLNYHRVSLADRMELGTDPLSEAEVRRFSERTVSELNRLWPLVSGRALGWSETSDLAAARVERVLSLIDEDDWHAPSRVKPSLFMEPWFRVAGVDGMFNPFGQEPLVVKGALPIELPFLMSHELAHVRGIANEGDANLVGLLATVTSDNPQFQYSGWLLVWGYLRIPESQLDPGPRMDLEAIRARLLAYRIRGVSNFQTALLDAHLKANAVPGGIRSYSDFLTLAIASQSRWEEFR